MVTRKGRVKIMDFGLAKLKSGLKVTKTGCTVGTIPYSSPEQVSGIELDQRSDIFSFGVVLYELLTGKLPFQGEYQAVILYAIMNMTPEPITAIREDVPPALEEIVFKALEKAPADRYQSVGEMLMDLRELKRTRESGIIGKSKSVLRHRAAGNKTSRLGLTALLGVLFVGIILWRSNWLSKKDHPFAAGLPVGVMYFDNQTGDPRYDYLRKALAEMLITDLAQSRALAVLTYPRMFELLRQLGREDVQVIDESVGVELCRLANVEVMLRGSLIKTGNFFAINAQVLEVGTKQQLHAYFVKDEGEGSILGHLIDDLSRQIKSTLVSSGREQGERDRSIAELTTNSLQAYKYYLAGREASFRVYHDEAMANFEKAVAADSTFTEAYLLLARQASNSGRNSYALEVLERLKKRVRNFDQKDMLRILLEEAFAKNDMDLRITYLKQMLRLDPRDIATHFDLGLAYYQFKMMFDEGIKELERVLELDPQGMAGYSSYTYNVLGYAYMRKGEYSKALEAFEKYVRLSPNQADPLDSVGEAYRIVGQYDEAVASFEKALAIKPDFTSSYIQLGDTYVQKGMYQQAMVFYRMFLSAHTSDFGKGRAYVRIARLELLRGEAAAAERQAGQALNLNNQMVEAHWIRGLSLTQQKRLDLAKAEAQEINLLIERSGAEKDRVYYHHLLGEIALVQDQHKEAIAHLGNSAEMASLERVFFLKALGDAYAQAQDLDRAIEQYRFALAINPNHALSHYMLAQCYSKKGIYNTAGLHLNHFLTIMKDADQELPELIGARQLLAALSMHTTQF